MGNNHDKKYNIPLGLLFSLTLVGLLLLSAMMYNRAEKFQRFIEPIIAVSRPKITFALKLNKLLIKEFGNSNTNVIRSTLNSIIIHESVLRIMSPQERSSSSAILGKLGSIFLAILKDPDISPYIDLILVNRKIPRTNDVNVNIKVRQHMQDWSEQILNSIYKTTPELERNYSIYFTATAMPVRTTLQEMNWIEFRFIFTERLQKDIVKELGKYLQ